MNKQQEYFERLTTVTHPKDLKVALTSFNSSIDKYTPGKRYNHTKYQIHDERNIAVNEIVFDFDWRSYKANYQKAKLIIEALDNRDIPYTICATGGKGIHIHAFFNKLMFSTDEGKKLFKQALSYHFSYKHLRLWFWSTIIREADIDEKYKKKQIDPKVLKFNYYNGSTHLIREIGGRKYEKDSEGEWKYHYKTYVPKEEFKAKKPVINNIEAVKYPPTIPTFDIDENELILYLKQFIKAQEKNEVHQLTNERIAGKYIELDGVLKLREGLEEGNRSSGAAILAIACRVDNLGKKEAYKIMGEYVEACSQTGTEFKLGEGTQWIDWTYTQEKPFWNCQLLEDIGLHERSTCEHCQMRNRESREILTQTTLLTQIKSVLDEEIVGEDDTKLLIFLLCLSKNFPSKTGRPGWNIPQDPMSQNVILSSDSASGKTWLTKKILQLFGDENSDYFIISRLTKSAINYYTDINMDGKVIFIEEMQGLDENTAQLRVWMSEGSLNLQTVEKVKDEEGNEQNKLVTRKTQGQPVFISNQAEGIIEDQLNNRSWVLSTDVTDTQTGKILDYQDKLTKGIHKVNMIKARKLKEALKLLKPYHFTIPFADRKAMGIPLTTVRSRRDYDKFLTLIKCSAYLHQLQREIVKDEKGNEFIICDIKDYEIARQYSQSVLGATFSGLTNAQIDLLQYIKNSSWKTEFGMSDIMRNLGKSQSHWHGLLKQLSNLGFITVEKSVGNSYVFSIVESKAVNIINLPNGEDLLAKTAITLLVENDRNGKTENSKIPFQQKPTNSVGGAISPNIKDTAPETTEFDEKKEKSHPLYSSDESNLQHSKPKLTVASPKYSLDRGGAITRMNIIKYLKKTNKHMVDFEEIKEKFKCEDNVLEKMVRGMISDGTIFEPRPYKYILLE